jgi:hypothetical protein
MAIKAETRMIGLTRTNHSQCFIISHENWRHTSCYQTFLGIRITLVTSARHYISQWLSARHYISQWLSARDHRSQWLPARDHRSQWLPARCYWSLQPISLKGVLGLDYVSRFMTVIGLRNLIHC